MNNGGNWRWVVTILVGILLTVVGSLLSINWSRVGNLEAETKALVTTGRADGERIRRVETQYEEIIRSLDRIEKKVDRGGRP